MAGYSDISVIGGEGERNAPAFITRGSNSLSKSLVTISVSNTLGGSRLNCDAGGHFRVNFLTIGWSIETGSPYAAISFNHKFGTCGREAMLPV